MDVNKVKKMESVLNNAKAIFKDLNDVLDRIEVSKEDIRLLFEYYQSKEWLQVYDDSNEGKTPQDLQCGVLSQDEVYNLLVDMNNTSVRMKRLADEIDM